MPAIKVRSFTKQVDHERGLPAVKFEGTLGAGVFVLKASGATLEVTTTDSGKDERGDFAFVDVTRFDAPGLELALSIEPELDDVTGLVGAAFTLKEKERSFTVYLHASGLVDGSASVLL